MNAKELIGNIINEKTKSMLDEATVEEISAKIVSQFRLDGMVILEPSKGSRFNFMLAVEEPLDLAVRIKTIITYHLQYPMIELTEILNTYCETNRIKLEQQDIDLTMQYLKEESINKY